MLSLGYTRGYILFASNGRTYTFNLQDKYDYKVKDKIKDEYKN